MTRVPVRLVLPTLLLLATTACSQRSETPPSEDTTASPVAEASPAPAGTEAAVEPVETVVPPAPADSAPYAPAAPRPAAPPTASPAYPQARSDASAPARGAALPPPSRSAGPPPPEPRDRAEVSRETATAREMPAPRPAPVRMVSVPAETTLRVTLLDSVASDTSSVEDRVSGRLANDVTIGGETVIPAGSRLGGVVTYVQQSAKVKGRAALTVRFRTLTIGSRTYDLVAEPVRREAAGTKAQDARDIGIGAGAGAVIGGLIGGRKGAGIGAVVGGAGGAGKVLASRGDQVRVPSGTVVATRLEAPLTVEVDSPRP